MSHILGAKKHGFARRENREKGRKHEMKKLLIFICMFALVLLATPAQAFHEPPVNLGFTNFLDAASPGPGWYLTEYIQYYAADEFNDDDGDDLPGDNEIDVFANLTQIIYQSNVNFLGGNPGIDVIIPIIDIDVDSDLGINANDAGFGDILIGPFIQWGPHMVFNRPFFQRFEFQVIAPTGKFDDDYALNPGSNTWSIDPYYTFTYFITPKLTTSLRSHFLWTEENDDTNLQAGDAVHFNYAVDYAVTDFLRFGVAGYYLKQIEDSEFENDKIDDTKEEVFAIGPGMVWHINKDLTFMAAVNFETFAENRPEGVRSTLRLIWKFW
jgi:anthranilate 1,2-dioxygenase (deaminating, decarboxylating) large subunit